MASNPSFLRLLLDFIVVTWTLKQVRPSFAFGSGSVRSVARARCSSGKSFAWLSMNPNTSFCANIVRARSSTTLNAWPWDDEDEVDNDEEDAVAPHEKALRKSEAEALRYQNRGARLQMMLKNRTAELKLMRNRVVILQDVARKLRQSQNRTAIEAMKLRDRVADRDKLEATLNATYDALDRQTTKLRRLVDDEKRARTEIALQFDDLVNELERKDMETDKAKARLKHDVSEIERRLKIERAGRKKDRDEFSKIQTDLHSRLDVANEVARGLEVELNRTIADVETLRTESCKDDKISQTAVQEEQRKMQFLKKELAAARIGEREAAEKLERMRKRLEKQERVVAARDKEYQEQERRLTMERKSDKPTPSPADDTVAKRAEEKVAIATAAVRAAEKREEMAESRLSKLQEELRVSLRDKDRLSIELRDALDQEKEAKERLESFQGANERREESMAKRVARAEKSLRRVEEEVDLLRSERDDTREALITERLKFSGERREEQRRYDQIMRDEREGFEAEIALLREQLSRQASSSARRQEQAHQQVVELNAAVKEIVGEPAIMQSNGSKDSSRKQGRKRMGRAGRVWKRIRSPSSWFAKEFTDQ